MQLAGGPGGRGAGRGPPASGSVKKRQENKSFPK
ncbi:hypothetical protein CBM2609_B120260 [Cupriavidus taiwanensis]|nr:hypothetical protein CBM2604_B130259 [Cupriavidus taiwanensis]SOZ31301.1 hypothetical protein CBM2609_B120260 [Cupriavidus taiwanensis]SOZ47379.1 hypothetical protein CBM2610_B100261 [Cupriavidus taiwanensis]